MRLARAHIVGFRSLRDLTISFGDVTVLVGANGAGKSSVLHALDWFFRGGPLSPEDVHGHQEDAEVTVGITLTDVDDADREELGEHVLDGEATFWRTWSLRDGECVTGRCRIYPGFAAVREHTAATPKRNAYRELRATRPELGLPGAGSASAVDEALAAWEAAHAGELEDGRADAAPLFGPTGQAQLANRMDFVLVRAMVDPDAETRDARGTLLRQLLDREMGEQSQMRERLAELERRVSTEMTNIMSEEGGAALARLSEAVTGQLAQLVPGGVVSLAARAPAVKVPSLLVDVRVADEGLDTPVGRQGHGFQRALLIAVVQQLASLPADAQQHEPVPGPPALVLALEEPELYQHPMQARHFAATLASLTGRAGAPVQVCYATHSEHFVDPAHYERLRRFQRRPGTRWPESQVTQATVERVAARLAGAVLPDQIPLRVQMTLRRQVAEAVFAKAVVLVEGDSDVGLLQGVADREGGLDRLGITMVKGHGKRQLLIPWAILTEVDVPCYVLFDGDAGGGDRMLADGQCWAKVEEHRAAVHRENALVLGTLGLEPQAQPATHVGERHAVFGDRLETELDAWMGFADVFEKFKAEHGEFRSKPDDAYRYAAATVTTDPPDVFAQVLAAITALVA